jgi:hypothetical protein
MPSNPFRAAQAHPNTLPAPCLMRAAEEKKTMQAAVAEGEAADPKFKAYREKLRQYKRSVGSILSAAKAQAAPLWQLQRRANKQYKKLREAEEGGEGEEEEEEEQQPEEEEQQQVGGWLPGWRAVWLAGWQGGWVCSGGAQCAGLLTHPRGDRRWLAQSLFRQSHAQAC